MKGVVEILMPIREFQPYAHHAFLDDEGNAWVPHAFVPAARRALPLHQGLTMGWAPFPQVRGALLALWSGSEQQPSEEAIAVAISRNGIRQMIADLQSIDQQLETLL